MQKVAEELAQTWGSVIEQAIEDALEDWHGASAESVHHQNRTRSSYLWDCAIARLREALTGSSDFVFQDAGQTMYILYKSLLRIQLKGLNRHGRTSSARTKRVSQFQNQLPFDAADLAELTNVYLTYQLDPYETIIQSISLACPLGRDITWVVPVDTETRIVADLFLESQEQRTASTGGRLRLKLNKDAEAEDGAV